MMVTESTGGWLGAALLLGAFLLGVYERLISQCTRTRRLRIQPSTSLNSPLPLYFYCLIGIP